MKTFARAFSLSAMLIAPTHRPPPDSLPAAAFLSALPDGEAKRQFITDCTGCHTFRAGVAYPGGEPRSQASWLERATLMLQRFGAASGFPVIGPARNPAATAEWLAKSLPPLDRIQWQWRPELEGQADIREYLLPEAGDLPHDVGVFGNRIIATGMFTSRMYILDPETGKVETEATPEPNPRALEIDAAGNWWVVLGSPHQVARRSPNGIWKTWDVGFYAHSVAIAPDGGIWANGHFTHHPELVRRIDPATSEIEAYEIPAHPAYLTTTVPYEIRVAPNGAVWMSELEGNRIARVSPAGGEVKVWSMPMSASGPRRLDVDPDGIVWIPEYGANKLARFDPRTETFKEYALPLKDTAPYVARYDSQRKVVWLGTGMADAVFRFDPKTERFIYYRLPTVDALVRHLTIAPNGDVWIAPGSSPGTTPARLVRLRPR